MIQFASFSDFIAMGGYGFYVWLAVGVSSLAMLGLCLDSWLKRKALFKSIKQQARRAQRQQSARDTGSKL